MRRGNSESGFALLFIYAMAATIAITLLLQLPSNAFEAQRQREQLLIDRGEQYTRGIQLYVRKFNKYPPDFDALENTSGQRFLRKRYTDPLTGKDEWRLIHAGPGGVLTDSLLTKKKDPNAPEKQTFITEIPTVVDPANGTGGVNIATRRTDPNNPNNANNPNGFNGGLNNTQQMPGSPVAVGPSFPGQSPLPGQTLTPFDPNNPQQANTGVLTGGLMPGTGATGAQNGTQPPGSPLNFPGTGQGGAATNLINQLLTTPRPGGLNGTTGATGSATGGTVDAFGNPVQPAATTPAANTGTPVAGATALGGSAIGGGIAGVASKLEQEGIKNYNKRSLYNEWEFVYDITKDTSRTGGVAIPQAATTANPAATATGAAATATPATATPSTTSTAPTNPTAPIQTTPQQ